MPKTAKEKSETYRKKLAEQGIKEVRGIKAYPEDEVEIKLFAKTLFRRRQNL